jgi:hypothetical protein
MFLEDIEFNDWSILPSDGDEERKQKSISTYWLHNWFPKVSNITFPTHIYNSLEDVPDILPYEKSIVRHENKSPKDSALWKGISTKPELIDLFYTSLRCKTNPGSFYCVRQHMNLGEEYRCFWNNGLVAISSEGNERPNIQELINYIKSISPYISYHRCVFDISQVDDPSWPNKYIFVEFNSWETNSGAHRFNWKDDTEIFYENENNFVCVRWNGGEVVVLATSVKYNPFNSCDTLNKSDLFANYTIKKNNCYQNTLFTDKYIYIANDIWLGRFDLNLKPLNWTRGIFRFCSIHLCEDGGIFADGKYYYYDLTPKNHSSLCIKSKINEQSENKHNKLKYGFAVTENSTGKEYHVRIIQSCNLILDKDGEFYKLV